MSLPLQPLAQLRGIYINYTQSPDISNSWIGGILEEQLFTMVAGLFARI